MTTGVIGLLSSAMVVAAVRSEGSTATNVQLDDATVWVTNAEENLVGRLNVRIDELDFFYAAADQPDVVQDGRSVLFTSLSNGVQTLDGIRGNAIGDNTIPFESYRVNGGVGAVFDAESGNLWVGSADVVVAPEYPKQPDAAIEPGAHVVVSQGEFDASGRRRGKLLVLGSSGWYEIALGDDLEPIRPAPATDAGAATSSAPPTTVPTVPGETLPEAPPDPLPDPVVSPLDLQLADVAEVSAVGDRLVALTSSGELVLPDGQRVQVDGDEWRLQQAGPAADAVLVASTAGLFSVDLGGGQPRRLSPGNGHPAAPVRTSACSYGAWWGSDSAWSKHCDSDDDVELAPVPEAAADAELVWRVNAGNVALNSWSDGGVWAEHEGTLALVGNWSDAEPDDASTEPERSTGPAIEVDERRCTDGSASAPIAGADEQVGVRPRASIIDLLYNDEDPNCEPIAITDLEPEYDDEWGSLTVIDDGQHVLYSPSSEWQNESDRVRSFSFTYRATDAAGNRSDPVAVNVSVYPYTQNSPPELRPKEDGTTRVMRTEVEENVGVGYDVRADWWDPNGDDLRLAAAIPKKAGEVSSTADGVVTYLARGVTPGDQQVAVTMSDGYTDATEDLTVTVQPAGQAIKPDASDDFVSLAVGTEIEVRPLDNDSDGNADELTLLPLWEPGASTGFEATTDAASGVVTVRAIEEGTHLLPYRASDGTGEDNAWLWVNVLGGSDVNRSPIAVPDQVKLRPNRVINVDVLANDVDLDGDMLAVVDAQASTSTDVDAGQVRASVVDRRMVQIEVVPGPNGVEPTGPFTVTYQIRDGYEATRAAATTDQAQAVADSVREAGSITVFVQPPSADQPPQGVQDRAVVRTGDVVAIPVLRNDVDPDGDQIVLRPLSEGELAEVVAAGGFAWTEGRTLYVQGGAPTTQPWSITYGIEAGGVVATGEAIVRVEPEPNVTTNPNEPPKPPRLELRAVRGSEVRLRIPLTGIDPDGDAVTLEEVGGADQGNTVTIDETNPDTVWFGGGRLTGPTDSLTYVVRDRYGESQQGVIEVMLIDDIGLTPQAHDDVFRARPGRTISIPVLDNDASPLDRPLSLEELTFFDLQARATETPVNGDAVRVLDQTKVETRGVIEVTVPTDGMPLIEHYRITDGLAQSDAYILVTPDRDAPNVAPLAVPDRVPVEAITDLPAGARTVTFPVVENDRDPDDGDAELILTPVPNQRATVVDGELSIELSNRERVVLYQIEDTQGATAIGRVTVPGTANHPPELSDAGRDTSLRTLTAGTPASLEILLSEVTVDPDGDTVLLTGTDVSQPTLGEVERLPGDVGFRYVYDGEPLDSTVTTTVVFEVTDRPDASVTERNLADCNCVATLQVDIVVEASSPPVVIGTGNVNLPQVDEPAPYDLADLVTDAQGDALTFEIDSSRASAAGIEIDRQGSQLTLVGTRGGDDVLPIGTTVSVPFTVSDGGPWPATDGELIVTIVGTNKPGPSPATFPVLEAERGVPERTPNLLATAFNAFPDRPLVLRSSSVDNNANLTCTASGDCDFTSSTVGSFTITYTIEDAAQQTATGTMQVVVKGKPFAPGAPGIVSVGDRLVNLTWTPADMQGGEFVTYHVTVVETGETRQFGEPGGTFDGLRNNTTYHFTVVAENELGRGDASPQSSPAVPDRIPDPPVAIDFTDYGDQQVTVTWALPPGNGSDFSPISQVEVRLGGQTQTLPASTTTATFTGLQNGSTYTVDLRSLNNTDWGPQSGPHGDVGGGGYDMPSRFPDAPAQPTAVNSGDGGQPRITVAWTQPANNGGRGIVQYEVCRTSDGFCQTVNGEARSVTFDEPRAQSRSYTVVAINTDKNQPRSQPSPASTPTTSVGTPDVPTIADVTEGNRQLTVVASSTNGSGCPTVNLEYRRDGGAWQTSPTFTGLTNGTSYSFEARAVLPSGCGTANTVYASGPSAPRQRTPYGPLVAPSISASNGTTITWSYNTNRADDGRPGWTATLSGACGNQTLPTTPNYSNQTSIAPGQTGQSYTCTITVSASNQAPISRSATGTAPNPPPPPQPTLTVWKNGSWANGSGANWSPQAQYWIECSDGDGVFVNTQTGWTSAGQVNFAARYTDGAGNLSFGNNICFSDQRITVRLWTSTGQQRTAST